MFNIDKNKKVDIDLPIIEDNFHVLHYDEEPILYTGTNKYGNRILGSSVEESDDSKLSRFFHVIVDSQTYFDFIKQKISYLTVLQNSRSFFVIDKAFDESHQDIYLLDILKDVPADYYPSQDSLCPSNTSTLPYITR